MNLERKTAGEAIAATYELERCNAFNGWYADQLKSMADLLADEILHDEMDAGRREIARQKRLTILEILALPAEARVSAESVIAIAGAED
jgi:hypothetical protein